MQPRLSVLMCLVVTAVILCAAKRPAQAQPANTASDEAASVARGLLRAVDVKFEASQDVIHPASFAPLDAVAEVLVRFPELRIEIAGHTDASGSAEPNQRLSEQRAAAVKAYLVARHGIDADRLETAGYGEGVPIASNSTATGRALNRRVEFRILDTTAGPGELEEGVRRPDAEGAREDIAGVGADAAAGANAQAQADTARVRADADSLEAALERQVQEALRSALDDPDRERTAELVRRLEARLDSIAGRLTEEPTGAADLTSPSPVERPFALLPFTGIYFHSSVPVLLGLRADLPTSLPGAPRFQPEAALGFMPDRRARFAAANLVFPVDIPGQAELVPFLGAGLGFHDLDRFESVLNLLVGTEYRLEIGVVFAELMTQDLFDFNRIVVGFRQDF